MRALFLCLAAGALSCGWSVAGDESFPRRCELSLRRMGLWEGHSWEFASATHAWTVVWAHPHSWCQARGLEVGAPPVAGCEAIAE